MPRHEQELSGDTRIPLSVRTLWDGGGKLLTLLAALAGLFASGVRTYDKIGDVERGLVEERKARLELTTRVDKIESNVNESMGLVREEIVGLRSELQNSRNDLRLIVTHLNLTATRRNPIPPLPVDTTTINAGGSTRKVRP
jgi:hypothetical protein